MESLHEKKAGFLLLHIGQAGVQLGHAIWELLNIEHGVQADGKLVDDSEEERGNIDAFYHEMKRGYFSPAAIFADTEPTCFNELKRGVYKDLFFTNHFVDGMENAAGNFARGMYTVGKEVSQSVVDLARRSTEGMEHLRGIMVMHSCGGGTGSGLTPNIMMDIEEDFDENHKSYQFTIIPSDKFASSVTEPYNWMLHTHYTRFLDMMMMYDNQSVYNICTKLLKADQASFTIINRIIAQTFSNITVCERFPGLLNTEMHDICTNLVPFPELHYNSVAHAPFTKQGREHKEENKLMTLLRSAYGSDHCLVSTPSDVVTKVEGRDYNFTSHKNIACANIFRGESLNIRNIQKHMRALKQKIPFVPWLGTPLTIGLSDMPCYVPPNAGFGRVHNSVTVVANTTALAKVFSGLQKRFMSLYKKKAFVHWYEKEGMPQEDWADCQETCKHILSSYAKFLMKDGDSKKALKEMTDYLNETEEDGEEDGTASTVEIEGQGGVGDSTLSTTEDETEKSKDRLSTITEEEGQEEEDEGIVADGVSDDDGEAGAAPAAAAIEKSTNALPSEDEEEGEEEGRRQSRRKVADNGDEEAAILTENPELDDEFAEGEEYWGEEFYGEEEEVDDQPIKIAGITEQRLPGKPPKSPKKM